MPPLLSISLTSVALSDYLLVFSHVDTLPQAFHLELLACSAAVDVLDVVGSCLEVAGGVVAARDEDVVLLAKLKRLVDRNRRAL